jgi:hypothetical protein
MGHVSLREFNREVREEREAREETFDNPDFSAFAIIAVFAVRPPDGTTLAYGFQGGTDDSEERPARDDVTPQERPCGRADCRADD